MITECYIKGRFDFGVGKCAVVIRNGNEVVHKVAWKVPEQWEYDGEVIKADQQNCEILAATYAVQWCMQNEKPLVNIYANTTTTEKWYYRMDFPESRKAQAKAYMDMVDRYYSELNKQEKVEDRIAADYIPKNDESIYNRLVNELAENVK